jgi:hypothetical protein
MENILLSIRSRLLQLCRTVILANTKKSRSNMQDKKQADFRCNDRSGKSVTVDVAEKRRTMERLTSSWLDLINPVGTPLEDVVMWISDETPDEGGPHLMKELVAAIEAVLTTNNLNPMPRS